MKDKIYYCLHRNFVLFLSVLMMVVFFEPLGSKMQAASRPTVSKKVSVDLGEFKKLSIKKNGFVIKKVTAKSKDKSIAKVAKVTKSYITVKGVKKGSAKLAIRIKAAKKGKKIKIYSLTTKVTVNAPAKETQTSDIAVVNESEFNSEVSKADVRAEEIINNVTLIEKADTYIPGETYTGTAYYVSEQGDDTNDGTTMNSAVIKCDVSNHTRATDDLENANIVTRFM